MRPLLSISADLDRLADMLADSLGVMTPEIEAYMSELDSELREKADGYAALIGELEARAAARRAEAQRLEQRAKIDARSAETLKERIKLVMQHHGIRSLETQRYRITVATNGGSPPITVDMSKVPPDYLVSPPPVVDTTRIRAELIAGKDLAFARFAERGTHLRIS